MSDLGIGWNDVVPVAPTVPAPKRVTLQDLMLADAVALDRLIEFARRVRFVAHNSAAVRRLCDEILLRRPGTDKPGDGIRNHGG